MTYFELNNGVKVPALGFGVYQIEDAAQCEQAAGRAVKRSGVPRGELFIIPK